MKPIRVEGQIINNELLTILQCPECRSDSSRLVKSGKADAGKLICSVCDACFSLDGDVPDLTPYRQLVGDRWDLWKRHLEGYRNRTERHTAASGGSQVQRWAEKERAFADFIDAPKGRVLEVGCGPGSIRKHLAGAVHYFGVDPLLANEAVDFPFVVGVAEFLPFHDDSFDHLIVRSALDHFCFLNRFLAEAKRILRPGGRLFVEQVIHEIRGPISAAKVLAHAMKDWLDDLGEKSHRDAPKHISEFSHGKLVEECRQFFAVERHVEYNRNWYTPTQVFLCLTPRN